MYDRVLIAVDGSEPATRAAARGLELAAAFDASVDALHVLEEHGLGLAGSDDESGRLRERADGVLTDVEDLAAERDLSVRTELREGRPAARIAEYAAEAGADLVVLGRRGRTSLGERVLGGVTEHLLHRSDVPVLVVPNRGEPAATDPGYDRVLLPTDGSENADAAVPHAAALAREFDASVDVANVVDLYAAGGPFDAGGLDEAFVDRLEERGEAAVERVADRLADAAGDRPVETETAVVRTTSYEGAAAGLREYVDEHDVDCVAMGSHGRSDVGRQLLGSVASDLLRTVDVPVLIVKRDA